jgi:hypothetical protein
MARSPARISFVSETLCLLGFAELADARFVSQMRYLHHRSQENEAEILADAFRPARAPNGDFALGDTGTAA